MPLLLQVVLFMSGLFLAGAAAACALRRAFPPSASPKSADAGAGAAAPSAGSAPAGLEPAERFARALKSPPPESSISETPSAPSLFEPPQAAPTQSSGITPAALPSPPLPFAPEPPPSPLLTEAASAPPRAETVEATAPTHEAAPAQEEAPQPALFAGLEAQTVPTAAEETLPAAASAPFPPARFSFTPDASPPASSPPAETISAPPRAETMEAAAPAHEAAPAPEEAPQSASAAVEETQPADLAAMETAQPTPTAAEETHAAQEPPRTSEPEVPSPATLPLKSTLRTPFQWPRERENGASSAEEAPGEDDLQRIAGITAAMAKFLRGQGVTRFAQIAQWSEADVETIERLLSQPGRIRAERWIEQAQVLAAGTNAVPPERAAGYVPFTFQSAPPLAAEPHDAAPAADAPAVPATGPETAERVAEPETAAPREESLAAPEVPSAVAQTSSGSGSGSGEMVFFTPEPVAQTPAEPLEETVPPPEPHQDAPAPAAKHTPFAPAPAGAADPAQGTGGDQEASPVSSLAPALSGLEGLRSVRSPVLRGIAPPPGEAQAAWDDLKRIRGIGILTERRLHSLAVTSYAQIAAWGDGDIAWVCQHLGLSDAGEVRDWIEQARFLTAGREA